MSLRGRLVLLIVALVTLVAISISALHLDTLVDSLSAGALERSELASQQVKTFVTDRINQHSEEYAPPTNIDETKALWNQIVATDDDIKMMLEKTMALSPAILEINIAGQTAEILASSNPSRLGRTMEALEPFDTWRNRTLLRRLVDLVARRPDYQVTVPLGITYDYPPGNAERIFTIQIVSSSVLLRDALLPEVETLGAVSVGALLVSLVLTVLAMNRVLRPINRIEQTIDRIVQGNFRAEESGGGMNPTTAIPREFAAVESKLNLLGQQYLGVREDASELKEDLDQAIERMASQLDVATRLSAISRLTSGVAHEIKNPLNAIALRLDLLRARLDEPTEVLSGEIDILSREVLRLDRVVKTFLDFSRPVEVKLKEVDLAALAGEVTDLMTPQARLAQIDLTFEAPGGPSLIRGDSDILKQAVLNLVTNAFEAMAAGKGDGGQGSAGQEDAWRRPTGHSVRVSVGRVGEIVTLQVADNGPGIPAEVREKVFQLYFTTKTRGSGIGLAMTYRAVQLHNGTIEFVSDNGSGTVFRLQFPAWVRHA